METELCWWCFHLELSTTLLDAALNLYLGVGKPPIAFPHLNRNTAAPHKVEDGQILL